MTTLNWIKKYREQNGGDYPSPQEIESQLELQKQEEKNMIYEIAEDAAFHMYHKVVESIEKGIKFDGKKAFELYFKEKYK